MPEKAQCGGEQQPPVLGEIATGGEGDGMVLLAQLGAIGPGHQRQVAVVRRLVLENPLQVNLARCGAEKIGAAHHLIHTGCGIIDHDREMIGVGAVGAVYHEIAAGRSEVLAIAPHDAIFERDNLVVNLHPERPFHLFGRQPVAADPRIDEPFVVGGGGNLGDLASGAAAGVSEPAPHQLLCRLPVILAAPALVNHLAVPLKAEFFQRGEHIVGDPGHHARQIQILHAQIP